MQLLNEFRFDNLRGDLFGGITAAVIALPMALAFGVSSSLALEQMVLEDLQKGKPVFIAGAGGEVKQRLDKLRLTDRLRDGHVVETRHEALEKATAWLQDSALESATAGPAPSAPKG